MAIMGFITEILQRIPGDMKRSNMIILLFILALLLTGCSGRAEAPIAEPEATAVQTEIAPEATSAPAEAKDTAPAEQEPTSEPVKAKELSLTYDAKEQTFRVTGTRDYQSLILPEEIRKARVLEVEDEDFTMSVYLTVLREEGMDLQTELPGLIYRTAEGLRFVREYLRENAGAAYPSALAELPVVLKIDRQYGYQTDEEQITLKYNERGTHREFVYLLALMDREAVGWEHLGYAWYVGTCFNPYTEVIDMWPVVPKLPYYAQCIAGGIDPEHVSPADYRIFYDACARVCFERGLTHWGSYCESLPVTKEPDFSRYQNMEPGDTLLTAFTAASFLGWLDEAHGFEQVSLFCFGQKSFEEAFGTDFGTAYEAWKAWIIDTYPQS